MISFLIVMSALFAISTARFYWMWRAQSKNVMSLIHDVALLRDERLVIEKKLSDAEFSIDTFVAHQVKSEELITSNKNLRDEVGSAKNQLNAVVDKLREEESLRRRAQQQYRELEYNWKTYGISLADSQTLRENYKLLVAERDRWKMIAEAAVPKHIHQQMRGAVSMEPGMIRNAVRKHYAMNREEDESVIDIQEVTPVNQLVHA